MINCGIKYKGIKYSSDTAHIVATLHNQIENQLSESGNFRKYGNALYMKKGAWNQAIESIGSINKAYEKSRGSERIVDYNPNGKVNINVNPIADLYIDAYRRAERDPIDESGDAYVPYQRVEEDEESGWITRDAIGHVAATMRDKMGYEFNIIYDPEAKFKGRFQTPYRVVINQAYATLDTPIHELVAHPLVRMIKNTNQKLYKNLENEVSNSEDGQAVLDHVNSLYNGTPEENMEEAVVELLGRMTAEELDAKKNASLIQLLREFLEKMTAELRKILKSDVVDPEQLPENTTLRDLAKIIGLTDKKFRSTDFEILYMTPDGSLHNSFEGAKVGIKEARKKKLGFETEQEAEQRFNEFVARNANYEASIIAIEHWKKREGIKYDPDIIHENGRGFFHSFGAYNPYDIKQSAIELLEHIKDLDGIGGQFIVSTFTDSPENATKTSLIAKSPVYLQVYPEPEDIKWASSVDVYSGSTWNSSSYFSNVDRDNIGTSYSKAPSIFKIHSDPSIIASSLEELLYTPKSEVASNEQGIRLRMGNFEFKASPMASDKEVKLVNELNRQLERQYGINRKAISGTYERRLSQDIPYYNDNGISIRDFMATKIYDSDFKIDDMTATEFIFFTEDMITHRYNDLDKEIKRKVSRIIKEELRSVDKSGLAQEVEAVMGEVSEYVILSKDEMFDMFSITEEEFNHPNTAYGVGKYRTTRQFSSIEELEVFDTKEEAHNYLSTKLENYPKEQAEANRKIAKLKSAARKYPYSLIDTKFMRRFPGRRGRKVIGFDDEGDRISLNKKEPTLFGDDLPYQQTPEPKVQPKTSLEALEKTLAKGVDQLNKKITIYEERYSRAALARDRETLDELISLLEDRKALGGAVTFVNRALEDLREQESKISSLDMAEHNKAARTLREALRYVKAYESTIEEMVKIISKANDLNMTATQKASMDAASKELYSLIPRIKSIYIEKGQQLLSETLGGVSTRDDLDVEESLKGRAGDINGLVLFLHSLADTNDDILKLVDKKTKNLYYEAMGKTYDLYKDLMEAQMILEEAGVKDTEWMAERDENGDPTGDFVQEYDFNQFKKARAEAYKKELEKAGLTQEDKGRSVEERLVNKFGTEEGQKRYKKFGKNISEWFKENTVQPTKEEAQAKADKHWEYLIKRYDRQTAEVLFAEWLNKRRAVYYEYDPETQTRHKVTEYRRDLVNPIDKYKNPAYQEIQKNEAKRKYYETIMGAMAKLNLELPNKQYARMTNKMPQMRKGFVERVWKREGNKIKGMWTLTKEEFVRTEDEVEFGDTRRITDFAGNDVKFVPVYYISDIKNKKDLSLDITSTVANYGKRIHQYAAMNDAVDEMEILKDLMEVRDYFQLNSNGKLIKDPVSYIERKGSALKGLLTNEKYLRQKGTSNVYRRLDEYMNMIYYGQLKKDEGTWGTVDRAKTIDAFNKYTSLTKLAINIYSGISNITLGRVQTRLEAMAGEYFNNTELFEADKIYWSNLPGALGDIGARNVSGKLSLWSERLDVLQDFSQEVRSTDNVAKTRLGQMFNQSTLFALNTMGEFYIQNRISLALNQTYRYVDGKWQWKEKYMQQLDLEGKSKSEIKSIKKAAKKKFREGKTLWDVMEVKGDKVKRLKANPDYGVTEEVLNRFRLRQIFLNNRMHGIYNELDRNVIQKYALGRTAMLFRKFLIPAFIRRFAKEQYNENAELYTEGFYATLLRLLIGGKEDLKRAFQSYIKNDNYLKPHERANITRAIFEMTSAFLLILGINVISSVSGDDDDNIFLNHIAYQINRLYTEMSMFIPLLGTGEAVKILKSPAAGINLFEYASDVVDLTQTFYLDFNEDPVLGLKQIQAGKNKGDYRIVNTLKKLTPIHTLERWMTPEEQLLFYKKF